MAVHTGLLRLRTGGDGDVVDVTAGVAQVVRTAGLRDAIVTVFVTGSTAALTTMEYEPGGVADLKTTLERLAPRDGRYEHNRLNADDNAHAHLLATLLGPSLSIPLVEGHLALGKWQQVVLIDLDTRPRDRTVTVQVIS
jgi:secondary thiamine-phosphate synthase enzyme